MPSVSRLSSYCVFLAALPVRTAQQQRRNSPAPSETHRARCCPASPSRRRARRSSEKVRTAVTDPKAATTSSTQAGAYTVTFSLPGFSTLK